MVFSPLCAALLLTLDFCFEDILSILFSKIWVLGLINPTYFCPNQSIYHDTQFHVSVTLFLPDCQVCLHIKALSLRSQPLCAP